MQIVAASQSDKSSFRPRSSSSNRLPTSLRVLSAITTLFGSATPCKLGLVAEMPLAGEIGAITVLLEEFRDRRRLPPEAIPVAGNDDDRERRADWDAAGLERGAACRATCLPVPIAEQRAFLGEAINVRGWMAQRNAAT